MPFKWFVNLVPDGFVGRQSYIYHAKKLINAVTMDNFEEEHILWPTA